MKKSNNNSAIGAEPKASADESLLWNETIYSLFLQLADNHKARISPAAQQKFKAQIEALRQEDKQQSVG